MNQESLAELNRLAIIRLCHSAAESRRLRVELLQRLRAVIPFDYAYFTTTDPATQLSTSSVLVEEPPAWCMAVFLENEFLQKDFNKFSDLLRNHQPVSILSEATGNDVQRSQRYRDMLLPMAMEDELRAIFVADTACWGTLCLHRGGSGSRYTAAEAAYLAQLTPHIADGLRKALLVSHTNHEKTADEPGVLILTDDLSVVAMTAAAEYWLTELMETEWENRRALPLSVRNVVASLKAIERGLVVDTTPKIRLRTRSGQWLVLHASRLNRPGSQAEVSVIFEIAKPTETALVIMQAYQLTKREGEITQCVLRGWSTAQIADRLYISPNTVQDHLKAIFEKVDVASRGELAARIFTQQYQPKFMAGSPLDANGQFIPDDFSK